MHPLVSPGAGPLPRVPAQQPTNLFRFGEQAIWSSHGFIAGTALASTENRVFTTPLGQSGQGFATNLDFTLTNIKEGGRVPNGIAYDVFGVAAQVIGANAALTNFNVSFQALTAANLLQNIVNNGVLSWDFTQTEVQICPLMLAGAGGGVYGSVSASSGIDIGALNNGVGGIWMYRKHMVALPGATTFSVKVRFGAQTAAVGGAESAVIRIVLLGYYRNVIELG